jgi:hypothetical protein
VTWIRLGLDSPAMASILLFRGVGA